MFAIRRWNWSRYRASRPWYFRPRLEVLEDRLAPAAVQNLLDDGNPGSLRAVIAAAQPGDIVTFDPTLTGTLQLTKGPLLINNPNLTIQGLGAAQLTISGGGSSGVLFVFPGSGLLISGVTIADGNAPRGAGIENFGLLSVTGCAFIGNIAGSQGGAIFSSAGAGMSINISNSSFVGNSAPSGAAIFTADPMTLSFDTFTQNAPDNGMGGIVSKGPLVFDNVLLTTGLSFTATAGVRFVDQVVARFQDLESLKPPSADQFMAPGTPTTISWGDESISNATVVSDGSKNGFLVVGTHQYPAAVTYTIQITVNKSGFAAPAQGAAVVLTPSQSVQLAASQIVTGQAGSSTLSARLPLIGATLGDIGITDNATTTLFVATYATNPTNVPVDGVVFDDVRVTNAPERSVLVVVFHYAGTINGPVQLLYFNTAANAFQPVQNAKLTNDVANHLIIAVFSSTSVPTLASLNHTVFTISVVLPTPNTTTTTVAPELVSASKTLPPSTTTTFTSSGQLTLTLTPLQQSQFALSQSSAGGGGGSDGLGGQGDLPFQWLWDLLGVDEIWRSMRSSAGKKGPMPMQPSAGQEEEAEPDAPVPQAELQPGDDHLLSRYWAQPSAVTGYEPLLLLDPAARACGDSARMAYLGLFFAGTALLRDEKRRSAA